jgi:murein DD-endopeptidase MepM/ murein hydrolase activator NlpD
MPGIANVPGRFPHASGAVMKRFWTTAAVAALCAFSADAWATPQTQYLELVSTKHLRGSEDSKSTSHRRGHKASTTTKGKKSARARHGESSDEAPAHGRHKRRHGAAAEETAAESPAHGRRGRHHARQEEVADEAPVRGRHGRRHSAEEVQTSERGRHGRRHETEIKTEAGETEKVGRHDTLETISKRTGVTIPELARLNGLKKPYHVRLGARIKLPARRYYEVKSGDTLYSISHKFGVDTADLSAFNSIESGRHLRAGQKLYLPDTAAEAVVAEEDRAPAPTPAPERTVRRERRLPDFVEPFEGPGANASEAQAQPQQPQPQTAPQTLAQAQPQPYAPPPAQTYPRPTSPTQTPSTGTGAQASTSAQPVTIPPGPSAPYTRPTPAAQQPPASSQDFELSPQPRPSSSFNPPIATSPATSGRPIIQSSPAPSAADVATAGRGKFVWPASGPVISGFGPKSDGQRNDGVNIAATAGDPVRAAADGEVVYAGDQVPSFGNLVLIKHPGGWVTAYAHMGRILVKNRDTVVQGQEIGVVGQTGQVASPQVHFEIRYAASPKDKASPVDPGVLLPPR